MIRPALLSLTLLGLVLCTAGCAARSVKAGYALKPDRGILLGSITREGPLSAYRVHFRPLGQEKGSDFVETGCDTIPEPSCFRTQDFEPLGMKGDLFAVELEPGEYEVFSWGVVGGPIHVGPSESFSLRYRVQPGRVTYVGNFHFSKTERFGLGVGGAQVAYSKPFERDFSLVQTKYPALGRSSILIDVANPSVPRLGSGSGRHIMPMPVYLP